MLKLLKLQLYNFFMFKEVNVDFSLLKPGSIVFVQGINHDATDSSSNYSGKSTLIIDAFKWVFRGKYDRLKKATDVIGPHDKRTFARIVYDADGSRLIITRYRNDPKFKNYLTVKWKGGNVTGERVVESQEAFEKIVHMDITRFIYGTLFDNDSEMDLFKLKPAARNKMLGFMWQLDEFTDAVKVCSDMCSGMDKQLLSINHRLDGIMTVAKEINDTIKSFSEQSSSFANDRDNAVKALSDKISNARTIIENSNKIFAELSLLKTQKKHIRNEIEKLNKEMVDMNKKADKRNKAKSKASTYRSLLKAAKAKIVKLESDVFDITNGIEIGAVCGACGSFVTDDSKDRIINSRLLSIDKLTKRSERLKNKIKKHTDRANEFCDSDFDSISKQLSALSKESSRLEERIAHLSIVYDGAINMSDKIKEYKSKRKDLRNRKNPFADKILEKTQLRDTYKLEADELLKKKKEVEGVFKIYKFWSGPKGFKVLRNLILTERVALMSDEFSKYLDAFSDGSISGEWLINQATGDIECELVDMNTGKPKHHAGFSSAQRAKTSIAQDFALSNICAPDIGHINIDEKLDGALDDVGFYKILNYLRTIDEFHKVIFLTSHRAGVQNIADATLRIERNGSVATAVLLE